MSKLRPDLAALATALYRFLTDEGPVKSPAICAEFGISDADLRELVNHMRRRGMPGVSNIASHPARGYWIAETPADVMITEAQVYSRFEPMRDAMHGLRKSMSMPLTSNGNSSQSPCL